MNEILILHICIYTYNIFKAEQRMLLPVVDIQYTHYVYIYMILLAFI